MSRLRRHKVRPEEAAAASARLRALAQEWAPADPVVTGGWVPTVPALPSAVDTLPEPAPSAGLHPATEMLVTRLGLPSGGAAGLVAVAVLAVVIALAWGWYTRAKPVVAAAGPSSSPGAAAVGGYPSIAASPVTAVPTTPATVVVDVAGRVRHPGLVTLPTGSRVADALRAAGGARPHTDLTALNLAAVLVDGEQILVGRTVSGAVGGTNGPGAGGTVASGPGQQVDLNTADAAALDALPGIGPVLAQRIVDYRTAHGRFRDVGQLQEVSGIGPAKFADLRALVRV